MTLSPVSASTVDITSIDVTKTAVSTKKKSLNKVVSSSLSFQQTSPLTLPGQNPFLLGTLFSKKNTFNNKATTLNLSINGTAGGTAFVLDLIYQFVKPAGSKEVQITSILTTPVKVVSGNLLYTISADGFVEQLGTGILTSFRPAKGDNTRSLYLQGSYTVTNAPPPAVPLPAAGLMLLGALGAVAAIRRRVD